MRRLGLTILTLLLSTIGFAAEPNWKQVASSPDNSVAVLLDINSVKVRNGRLTAWIQDNYVLAKTTSGREPKQFLSTVGLTAFDCASERYADISIVLFSQNHAKGEIVGTEDLDPRTVSLEYSRPGSIASATLDAVCRVANGPRPKPTQKPAPNPTQLTGPSATPQTQLTNDRHYTNSDGNQIHSPSYTTNGAIPAGASAQCADGTYSFSQHHQGTCSHHGGVTSWIN